MSCARLFICALWSPAGKGLTSWLSFVVSNCEFVTFHWYPGSGVVLDNVLIPDLCTLTYFAIILMGKRELVALLSLSSWCLVMVVWLFHAVP